MNYTEFEKKVKSMNAHDIIMAMVEGLRTPRTKIDMLTFGEIEDGICYGCAATNAILHIVDANKEEVVDHIRDRKFDADGARALEQFEIEIDWLRRGMVDQYNQYAKYYDFAPITPMPGLELPPLYDDYTEEQLQQYEKLAKYQLTVKNQRKLKP